MKQTKLNEAQFSDDPSKICYKNHELAIKLLVFRTGYQNPVWNSAKSVSSSSFDGFLCTEFDGEELEFIYWLLSLDRNFLFMIEVKERGFSPITYGSYKVWIGGDSEYRFFENGLTQMKIF